MAHFVARMLPILKQPGMLRLVLFVWSYIVAPEMKRQRRGAALFCWVASGMNRDEQLRTCNIVAHQLCKGILYESKTGNDGPLSELHR